MKIRWIASVALPIVFSAIASANVFNMGPGLTSLETVPVGNPGNAGELSGTGGVADPQAVVGAVSYAYRIGKFEVTAGQYTQFLNAVARTDAHGLYNTNMATVGGDDAQLSGSNITRSGSPGNYIYIVADGWENRPVNWVSWGDAARFANWLHNGQPETGVQDHSTTEDGAYYLDGATSDGALLGVIRKPNATWVIPSEDEWYKAAYHKNDGVTGNYWEYPTSTDSVPSNQLIAPDPGNNATFYQGAVWPDPSGYSIGSPYYRTEVGAHENSESPYGAFDMAGNMWEWNETLIIPTRYGARGGSFTETAPTFEAIYRIYTYPTHESATFGFRVSYVPEPASAAILAVCGVGILNRRRNIG